MITLSPILAANCWFLSSSLLTKEHTSTYFLCKILSGSLWGLDAWKRTNEMYFNHNSVFKIGKKGTNFNSCGLGILNVLKVLTQDKHNYLRRINFPTKRINKGPKIKSSQHVFNYSNHIKRMRMLLIWHLVTDFEKSLFWAYQSCLQLTENEHWKFSLILPQYTNLTVLYYFAIRMEDICRLNMWEVDYNWQSLVFQ